MALTPGVDNGYRLYLRRLQYQFDTNNDYFICYHPNNHNSLAHWLIQDYRFEHGDSLKRGMGGGFHEG